VRPSGIADADADGNGDGDSYSNSNAQTHAHAQICADTEASSHTAAETLTFHRDRLR
jgi:hypothetical protein